MSGIMDEPRARMFDDIHAASEAHWQKKAAKEAAAREKAADRDEFHFSVLEVAGDLLLGAFSVASFTLLMAVL